MVTFTAPYGAMVCFFLAHAQAIPVTAASTALAPVLGDWVNTLSDDTRHRLDLARAHLDDDSAAGQAFRNDTIMRINIEREALDNSLIDLSQAFEATLPAPRSTVSEVVVVHNMERSAAIDEREDAYMTNALMIFTKTKRSTAEDEREAEYFGNSQMTYPPPHGNRPPRSVIGDTDTDTDVDETTYTSLLDRSNLALGALERINVAHRVRGVPEVTLDEAKAAGAHGDSFVSNYWNASVMGGSDNPWAADQAAGQPNFVEGGQANGFGFTQSTFHKLHCLANLRTILAWHITGQGEKMTTEMNVHMIHCLNYIRSRELANPDRNEEPIDTVDYKGMGIH